MTLKQHAVWVLLAIQIFCTATLSATLLTFEDLTYKQTLSGKDYQGLFFEFGNEGVLGEPGTWVCPMPTSGEYYNYPFSGTKNISNGSGCSKIGIQFPEVVNVLSSYFSVQGTEEVWAEEVRVSGYVNNTKIDQTDWLKGLNQTPIKLEINLMSVNRIVIESRRYDREKPGEYTFGWFGMDDLSFEKAIVPEPATLALLGLGIIAAARGKR